MGQKKLHRFEELKTFSNVLQYPQDIKGNWEKFFQNEHPLILELACGKGEYAIGLGQIHPEQNFVGVDLKGNRIWVGAKKALQNKLSNVAFLRIEIDKIPDYFAQDEVSEIWITFPDPQPRTGKAKKRLTHPKFLRLYGQILKKNAAIHLKTDNPDLYNFTKLVIDRYGCKLITDIGDISKLHELPDELKIKTHYEKLDIAQSSRVHYLKFSLPEHLPGKEEDKELQQFLKENEPGTIN